MASRVAVVVPVFNGGASWLECAAAISKQTLPERRVLVIDSGSSDGSDEVAERYKFELVRIKQTDFDHGGTRQAAVELVDDSDIVVFLTQDAIMGSSDSLVALVAAFDDGAVGLAYGRQLPRREAASIEAHARYFNYPAGSETRRYSDSERLGLRAAFVSNSFAAYRISALQKVGGFPSKIIFAEDVVVAARLLMGGWAIRYAANAQVYHSHAYTFGEEFRRYFDIGVFHRDQEWILREFGKAEAEGRRFVASEIKYLAGNAPHLIPSALLRTIGKYIGYRMGCNYMRIPYGVRSRLSMHPSYWKGQMTASAMSEIRQDDAAGGDS